MVTKSNNSRKCPKFCKKIKAGKDAQNGEDFMIIARVESILNKGLNDAITRLRRI